MSPIRRNPDLRLSVVKSARPPFGYVWEIRVLGFGRVVERSTRSFSTAQDARQAAEAAMQLCRRTAAGAALLDFDVKATDR